MDPESRRTYDQELLSAERSARKAGQAAPAFTRPSAPPRFERQSPFNEGPPAEESWAEYVGVGCRGKRSRDGREGGRKGGGERAGVRACGRVGVAKNVGGPLLMLSVLRRLWDGVAYYCYCCCNWCGG